MREDEEVVKMFRKKRNYLSITFREELGLRCCGVVELWSCGVGERRFQQRWAVHYSATLVRYSATFVLPKC